MNGIAIIFTVINAVALYQLPRRWAPVPFLIGACYMTLGQGIDIGPFSFTVIRILVLVGIVRIMLRGERLAGGMNALDRLVMVWAFLAVISSIFHENPSSALVFRLGLVYNACGIYFLLRVFCQSLDDIVGLYRIILILLIPVALEMLFEKATAHNLFSALGGVSEMPSIREGKIRAQGPFAHSILAGTVGAVSLPFAIALWRHYRKEAIIGIAVCFAMVYASTSSGPIMSTLAAIGALWMWKYRDRMKLIRWLAISAYIGIDLVMEAPAYFLLKRIDITGGSTGWHRARLIQSAFQHLNEWWLGGTDYTRHWMPTGVSWSAAHTDITNQYLKMGVLGGLPLMLIFIAVLIKGFNFVGRILRETDLPSGMDFMVWALGASLFAHAATFISVSYFDQSFVFLYLTLAVISSTWSAVAVSQHELVPVHNDQYTLLKIGDLPNGDFRKMD